MPLSAVRKQVESLFADSVKGRVRFMQTTYHGRAEFGRYWITVDGQEIVTAPSHWVSNHQWTEDHAPDEIDRQSWSKEFAEYASLWAKGGLGAALKRYLSLSFEDILASDSALIRAIGMLDRRLGKRRLQALDVNAENPLVRLFYRLRCEAEGLRPSGPREAVDTAKLKRPDWPWAEGEKRAKKERARRAEARLDKAKRTRKRLPLLARIHRGELTREELDNPVAVAIHAGFESADDRDALLARLRRLDANSKVLRSGVHARGVVALMKNATGWVRPLEQWIPTTHNPDRQFASLARHLWAAYDVPAFMDQAWLRGTPLQQEWFKHIGAGRNIRSADGLPVPLTKKMAHHFLEAPATYSIEAAFRWAQTLALEGDRRLVDALRETRLVRDFQDDEFWLSVIRFFVRNPLLDRAQINPIVDYLWNQRYEPRVEFVDRGVARELGPAQPNLSMRGRTAVSLLRDVAQWHRQLGREVSAKRLLWRKSDLRDFRFVEGSEESRNMRIWRIRELLSSQELIAEGRRLHHCVSSYAASCHAGKCSIWSMVVETNEGIEPLLTIEVGHDTKEIRQVRGIRNRLSTEKERDVIRRWALQEKLGITAF